MERPPYGTRRMAAMLTRILGIPVKRKEVQRIFRKIGYVIKPGMVSRSNIHTL
jgi:hypothetical protein